MTRDEALKEADRLIEELLLSGDEAIFSAARRPDGSIDKDRLVTASLRARDKLADKLMEAAE